MKKEIEKKEAYRKTKADEKKAKGLFLFFVHRLTSSGNKNKCDSITGSIVTTLRSVTKADVPDHPKESKNTKNKEAVK